MDNVNFDKIRKMGSIFAYYVCIYTVILLAGLKMPMG